MPDGRCSRDPGGCRLAIGLALLALILSTLAGFGAYHLIAGGC